MPEKKPDKKRVRRKTPPKTLPGAKQEGHPNLKRGEQYGNTGAGPKPKFVRERLLKIGNKGLDYYEKVADGEEVIVVPSGLQGVPDALRKPTHRERTEVIDVALRHSLPQKVEVTVERDDFLRLVVDVLRRTALPNGGKIPNETIAAVVNDLADSLQEIAG